MPDNKTYLEQVDKRIMKGLKDFQRATVERIDYLYRNGITRVLVSDEVGLGKTLIARGTVSKMARLREAEGDNLFKVVYICSNASIADQNLSKLRISHDVITERVSTSRLSMQHLNIYKQENAAKTRNSFIQLIPLTPETSFRMTSGTGNVGERALMFALLKRLPELKEYKTELEIIMKRYAEASWNYWAKSFYEAEVANCDKESGGEYVDFMLSELRRELSVEIREGVTALDELREACLRMRADDYDLEHSNEIVKKLRMVFAKISMDKLDPDLVIMDEFQRFKYLINADPESETGMLSNKFFHTKGLRMLLLSATPYKMYSTLEEIDESNIDEHYEEFLGVMRFLNEDKADAEERFETVWRNYSIRLQEITSEDTAVIAAKNAAEEEMYRTVCRTERITASENADIIDDTDVHFPLEVMEQDIHSYMQAQELIKYIEAPYSVPVDYIKSTPYLLSFMRDYQLKRNIEKYFKKHKDEVDILRKDTFWIKRRDIDHYKKIPNNNARLDRVMGSVLKNGAEKLLWIPPSRPYYELQGAFSGTELSTKTLIFSSWEMVPRMIASMISYEAERRTVGKVASEYHDRNVHYFYTGERRYPSARLTFTVRLGMPAAMTLFCLLYPSKTLAEAYDPIDCMNKKMTLKEIRRKVKKEIVSHIKKYTGGERGRVDKRWYYIAPMLLDGDEYVNRWFDGMEILAEYDSEEEKSSRKKGFRTHLDALWDLYNDSYDNNGKNLGRIPSDLADVLTDMVIGSPAICIFRSYKKYSGKEKIIDSSLPSELARVFINRMNTPESTAVIDLVCGRKNEDAHWQNLLKYCIQGNLQAVFDEYAHLIASGLDHDGNLVNQLHDQMKEAMDIRTTQYNIDTLPSFKRRINGNSGTATHIRSHFAVAFTKGDGKERDADRKKTLRNAFNSPFRPFVLATTSIGQEGLDFHNYCRKIVHWNLPSNPIDLEQREGRINRFECLAIRQNVARRYGDIQFNDDIWEDMFEEATRVEKKDGSSDLIPYWGLTESDDYEMIKIERLVPMYPFSRDEASYERLIKILSLYRLTLGQARQEELLEYLFKNVEDTDNLKKLFINLSPFYKQEENHAVK